MDGYLNKFDLLSKPGLLIKVLWENMANKQKLKGFLGIERLSPRKEMLFIFLLYINVEI